jgi:hypothetical protein
MKFWVLSLHVEVQPGNQGREKKMRSRRIRLRSCGWYSPSQFVSEHRHYCSSYLQFNAWKYAWKHRCITEAPFYNP